MYRNHTLLNPLSLSLSFSQSHSLSLCPSLSHSHKCSMHTHSHVHITSVSFTLSTLIRAFQQGRMFFGFLSIKVLIKIKKIETLVQKFFVSLDHPVVASASLVASVASVSSSSSVEQLFFKNVKLFVICCCRIIDSIMIFLFIAEGCSCRT